MTRFTISYESPSSEDDHLRPAIESISSSGEVGERYVADVLRSALRQVVAGAQDGSLVIAVEEIAVQVVYTAVSEAYYSAPVSAPDLDQGDYAAADLDPGDHGAS